MHTDPRVLESKSVFMKVRSIRDAIVHRGARIRTVFSTERGFAVSRDDDLFRGIYQWPSGCELPNSLVSMRPALATMVMKTISATNDFAATIEASDTMPSEIVPNLRFYSRGTNDREFVALKDVVENSSWDASYQ